jgi:hypothetical protein
LRGRDRISPYISRPQKIVLFNFDKHPPANSFNIFIGTLGVGLFRSPVGGQNWATINSGLPANSHAQSIVASGATIFAGLFGFDD